MIILCNTVLTDTQYMPMTLKKREISLHLYKIMGENVRINLIKTAIYISTSSCCVLVCGICGYLRWYGLLKSLQLMWHVMGQLYFRFRPLIPQFESMKALV